MTGWSRTIGFIAELEIGEEFSFDRFLREIRMNNRESAVVYRTLLQTAGYISRQRKGVYRKEKDISRSISMNKVRDEGWLRMPTNEEDS